MATTAKQPSNTWVDQVINLGLDKRLPFGAVNVVYDRGTGEPVGFMRSGKFYKMGQKVDKTSSTTSLKPEVSFSIDDLNKTLPDGGIDIHHVKDYLNSPDPKLADAAQKIIGMQSLGLWDNNGHPIGGASNPSDFSKFGKIVFTQADVDKKLAEINQAKQEQASSTYADQQKANDSAKASGRALPYPTLKPPVVAPATNVPGVAGATGTPTAVTTPTASTPASTGQTTKTFIDGLLRDGQASAPKATGIPKSTGKGTSGTGSTGNAGGKKIPPPPPLSQQDFLTKYGTTLAFIQSDPSLSALFNQAAKGNWQGPKFEAALQQSAWAHKYSAGAQLQEKQRLENPSTFGTSWNNMRAHIAQVAVADGLAIRPQDVGNALTPTGGVGGAKGTVWQASDVPRQDGTITQWALEHAGDTNFDEELKTHLATVGQVNLQTPGGTAAHDIMELKAYAGQMGLGAYALPPSNNPSAMGQDWFSQSAQSNLLGTSNLDAEKAFLLQQAKDRYKAFAPSLDAGQTVRNLAAPYINTLANLLEISPDKVDLSATTGYGKIVNDALMGTDATNQQPMTLTDFEKQVKARPEWGFTNNARDTLMPGVHDLLSTLGKVS